MFIRSFYRFFKILGKSLEVFGSVRKSSENIRTWSELFGNDCNTSNVSETVFWSPQYGPCTTSWCAQVMMGEIGGILPVAYRRICNGNSGLWLAAFFKAWDKSCFTGVSIVKLFTILLIVQVHLVMMLSFLYCLLLICLLCVYIVLVSILSLWLCCLFIVFYVNIVCVINLSSKLILSFVYILSCEITLTL